MRFLIIKTSALGDILQTLFAADYIKTKYKGATVDWLVEERFAAVCESCPLIDNVIKVDTRRLFKEGIRWIVQTIKTFKQLQKYDAVIDLQGNMKSGLLSLPIRAKEKVGFSFKVAPEWGNILFTRYRYTIDKKGPIQEQYLSLLRQHFKDASTYDMPRIKLKLSSQDEKRLEELSLKHFQIPYNTLMICFGSNWENKKLKKSHLIALLKSLEGDIHPHFLFIYSNKEEKERAKQLQELFKDSSILGELSVSLWQYMMLKTKGIICMDSAALHLAAMSKVRSFAFFGPSNSAIYNPRSPLHQAYQGSCPYQMTFTKRCKVLRTCKTGYCLKDLNLEVAYQALKAWLT